MQFLQLKAVDVHYGQAQALVKVSINVNEGEFITIVGSNGAGKTTTLKTISGVLHPTSGSIEFNGETINDCPPYKTVEKGSAHVPEGKGLFPYMTVQENLDLGAYVKRARDTCKESMERVFEIFPKLKERKGQLAGTLSGGEQQMLAVGRVLMSRPKLMMLDEPSLGLAPKLVKATFEVLTAIRDMGVTILLVEQNVRHALLLSDRAYVLENGRIVLEGKGKELVDNEDVKKAYLGLR